MLGAGVDVDLHTEFVDLLRQQDATVSVHLDGHQTRGTFDDVGFRAEQLEGVGGLQAEQTTADDGADRFAAGGAGVLDDASDVVEVVEGAVDRAAGQVVAGDRRDPGVGAGGEDEVVVGDGVTVVASDGAGVPVDAGGLCVHDVNVLRQVGHLEQGTVPGGDVTGEGDAVVGVAPFAGDHGDAGVRVAVEELGGGTVADHAEADDDGVGCCSRCGHDVNVKSLLSTSTLVSALFYGRFTVGSWVGELGHLAETRRPRRKYGVLRCTLASSPGLRSLL